MRVAAFLAALLLLPVLVQAQASPNARGSQSTSIQPTQTESGVLTFRVTTREVVLDLIALHEDGGQIPDLAGTDLQVLYSTNGAPARKHHHHPPLPPQIAPLTSLRVVGPDTLHPSTAEAHAGFQITASCLERSTPHYQLAFRPGPDGWTAGFHEVSISTSRPGLRLFYRHRYFVGQTVAPAKPPVSGSGSIEKLLTKDACGYPDTPLSISLRARLIDSGRSDVLRYQVAVEAESLSYLTLDAGTGGRQAEGVDRRVQIDYGVCTFNTAGRPIRFFQAPLDQILTSADYGRALARGFPHVFDLPAIPSLALTRIVVRDRATGNLGATDVPFAESAPAESAGAGPVTGISDPGGVPVENWLERETAHNFDLFPVFTKGDYVVPPQGPIGSFGSVVPAANSFCGDVYELQHSSDRLPEFRELDPIGSVYTDSLDVPNQLFVNTEGIPGVTPRTNLFGIDYHAVFWIREAGDYKFRMVSDDGATLWIDDRQIIDLDGIHYARGGHGAVHLDPGSHTMHVPYFQGKVDSVALLLWVQPPGENDWQIFNLRNFAPPGPGVQ